ncbi:MAG: Hint domain-containing protein [Pseudomonadota bacterium]
MGGTPNPFTLTGTTENDANPTTLTVTGDANYLFGSDAGDWTADTIAGSFSSQLIIDTNGNWTYTADATNASISNLAKNDSLTDSFTVEYDNGTGTQTTTITITINNTPCFTPGTMILTPQGARPVESLKIGDLVVTRDEGLQPIRWVGRKKITGARLVAFEDMRPIRLPANLLAPGWPDRDTAVSPLHRVLVRDSACRLWLNQEEVLVPAKMLVGYNGVEVERDLTAFDYIHILFDHHQVIYANGLPTESFHPGHIGLSGFEDEAREELLRLFPSLRAAPEVYGRAARYSLRQFEAQLLLGSSRFSLNPTP